MIIDTYGKGSITGCRFKLNQAGDNGGAIFVRRRSEISISDVYFESNLAENRGGSISVHQSIVSIGYCSFINNSVNEGYRGCIFSENIGNITITMSSFVRCSGTLGGFLASSTESETRIEDTLIANSVSTSSGGAVYTAQKSVLNAQNLTIKEANSTNGGALHIYDASEINLKDIQLLHNSATDSGGGINCWKSKIILDTGSIKDNYATQNGAGIHSEWCNIIINSITFTENQASLHGGGLYAISSHINLHNVNGVGNLAGKRGGFIFIYLNSILDSINLKMKLDYSIEDIIIKNNSRAQLKLNQFWGLSIFCHIIVTNSSSLNISHVHYQLHNPNTSWTFHNSARERLIKHNQRKIIKHPEVEYVCADSSSQVVGPAAGKKHRKTYVAKTRWYTWNLV